MAQVRITHLDGTQDTISTSASREINVQRGDKIEVLDATMSAATVEGNNYVVTLVDSDGATFQITFVDLFLLLAVGAPATGPDATILTIGETQIASIGDALANIATAAGTAAGGDLAGGLGAQAHGGSREAPTQYDAADLGAPEAPKGPLLQDFPHDAFPPKDTVNPDQEVAVAVNQPPTAYTFSTQASFGTTPIYGGGSGGGNVIYSSDFSEDAGNATLIGGAAVSGGMLVLTEEVNSQNNWIQIDGGGSFSGNFRAEFDLLIDDQGSLGLADGVSFQVGNDVNTAGVAEEPQTTGLALTIDTYDNGGGDVLNEFAIWFNNVKIASFVMDPHGDVPVPVIVEMEGSLVTVTYNGVVLVEDLDVGGTLPADSDFYFGARTGGSADFQAIDNVTITDTSGGGGGGGGGGGEPAPALDVTPTNDGEVLVNTILGSGIQVVPGSIVYNGAPLASGTFVGGAAAGIGIESGIILTSGSAETAEGPNNSDGSTTANGLPGDADLTAIAGVPTFDAAILEFDFISDGGDLFFSYVFASEEYNEYANSGVNDSFGFFLDGVNIALIPGTNTGVSINTVNGGNPYGTNEQNSEYFNNNDGSDGGPYFIIEYDGFTDVFTVSVIGLSPGEHHIKLAIADGGDSILDSGVFIQAGSFSDQPGGGGTSDAFYALFDLGGTNDAISIGGTDPEDGLTTSYTITSLPSDGTLWWDENQDGTYEKQLQVGDVLPADGDELPDNVLYVATSEPEDGQDEFTYTTTDSNGLVSAPATVTITFANTAPDAVADTNWAQEDTADASGNVLIDINHTGAPSGDFADHKDPDLNGDPLTVTSVDGESNSTVDIVGSYGTLDWAANGDYAYTLDNGNGDVQALDDGETLTDQFTYTVDDGNGGSDTATLTVTIFGTNDAPVAEADTNWAKEDSDDANGNVLQDIAHNGAPSGLFADVADTDVDIEPLTVTDVVYHGADGNLGGGDDTVGTIGAGLPSQYGELTLNSNGSYDYVVDNTNAAVQALNDGQTLIEQYTYTVSDGDATATSTLTITIFGTNDAANAGDGSGFVREAALDLVQDPNDLDAGNVVGSDPTSTAESVVGSVTIDFGGDPVTDITNIVLSTVTDPDNGGAAVPLTSGGNPVSTQYLDGSNTIIGYVNVDGTGDFDGNDVKVFELTLGTDGNFTFTLTDQIDHPDGDQTEAADPVDLAFVYTATDGFDSDDGTITITVRDDGPTLTVTGSAGAAAELASELDETVGADRYNSNLAETEDAGGNANTDDAGLGIAQVTTSVTGGLTTLFVLGGTAGADGEDPASPSGTLSFVGIPGGGLLTNLSATNGGAITLFLEGGDIVGRDTTNEIVFTIEIIGAPGSEQLQTTLYEAIDHTGDGNLYDSELQMLLDAAGAVQLQYEVTRTDNDGDSITQAGQIDLITDGTSVFSFDDDGPTLTVTASGGAAAQLTTELDETLGADRYNVALAETEDAGGNANTDDGVGLGQVTTSVVGGLTSLFVIGGDAGSDGLGGPDSGTLSFVGIPGGGLLTTLSATDGGAITLFLEGGDIVGRDTTNDMVFKIAIVGNQLQTTLYEAIDHTGDGNLYDSELQLLLDAAGAVQLQYEVTRTDGDGDTITVADQINLITDGTSVFSFDDDGPIAGTADTMIISNTLNNSGTADLNLVSFGSDGDGGHVLTMAMGSDGNQTALVDGAAVYGFINGSLIASQLTSNGTDLVWQDNLDGSWSAVTDDANADVAFIVDVNSDGTYTVTLSGTVPLDGAFSEFQLDFTQGVSGGNNEQLIFFDSTNPDVSPADGIPDGSTVMALAVALDSDGTSGTVNSSTQGMGVSQGNTIDVNGGVSEELSLYFAVPQDPATVTGPGSITRVSQNFARITFDSLNAGEYAIVVVHILNGPGPGDDEDIYFKVAGTGTGAATDETLIIQQGTEGDPTYISGGDGSAGDPYVVIMTGDTGTAVIDGMFDHLHFLADVSTDSSYRLVSASGTSETSGFDVETAFTAASSDGDGDTVNTTFDVTFDSGTELTGTAGDDVLIGDGGQATNQIINGMGGNDVIFGGIGADTIDGGTGDDVINGGSGVDDLTGGSGADQFVYDANSNVGTDIDQVLDFNTADDSFVFEDLGVTATPGDVAIVDLGGNDAIQINGTDTVADLNVAFGTLSIDNVVVDGTTTTVTLALV